MSNKELVKRWCHSAASFAISPECMEVVLFGGKKTIVNSLIAETAVLRFGKCFCQTLHYNTSTKVNLDRIIYDYS